MSKRRDKRRRRKKKRERRARRQKMPLPMPELHTICPETGQTFVRRFTGKYKGLPDGTLQEVLAELDARIHELAIDVNVPPGTPAWIQAEYLEHVLNFELDPPCGCGSHLAPVDAVAGEA